MNPLVKRFIAIGATSVVAVTGAFLIDPFEGNKNHAYIDMVGIATVCRGSTNGVKLGDYRTDEQCDKDTVEELAEFNNTVNKAIKVGMKPYEEIAYTSLTWNIGQSAFSNSTLVKKHNAGDVAGACREILNWNRATFSPRGAQTQIKNGEHCSVKKDGNFSCTVKGLTNRRAHEYRVCVGEDKAVNDALHALAVDEKPQQAPIPKSEGVDEGGGKLIVPEAPEVLPTIPPSPGVDQCRWKFFNICLKRD